MSRLVGFMLVAALLVLIGIALGGAIDDAYRQRVIFTRDGVTQQCDRVVKENAEVHFENCTTVP